MSDPDTVERRPIWVCPDCGRVWETEPQGCAGPMGGAWHLWVPGRRNYDDQRSQKIERVELVFEARNAGPSGEDVGV